MRVEVYDVYSEQTQAFSGEPEQVRQQLLAHYNFLKRYENASLTEDLAALSRQQAYFVEVKQ